MNKVEICPNRGCRKCIHLVYDLDEAFYCMVGHYYCSASADGDEFECIDGFSYETGDCPAFTSSL